MTITLTTEEKADILDEAADRLKGGRWTQGEIGCTKNSQKPVCLLGSFRAVLGDRFEDELVVPYDVVFGPHKPEYMDDAEWTDIQDSYFFTEEADRVESALLREVAKTLRIGEYSNRSFDQYVDPVDWNDTDGRTSRQVIGALRRTAKRLRAEASV